MHQIRPAASTRVAIPPPPGRYAWVDAAPFRAHLTHVAEVSGVPWSVIAVHAGVPVSLAARLLFRRRGRLLQRLPMDCAQRLLAVTPETALSLLRARMPSPPTSGRLLELMRRGWAIEDLAEELACPTGVLRQLVTCEATSVAVVLAHTVKALLASSDSEAAGRTLCAA